MPSGLGVIDQNTILTVLIHNLKTAWPTKIFEFLGQFTLSCMHHFSKEKSVCNFEITPKHAYIKLGVQNSRKTTETTGY